MRKAGKKCLRSYLAWLLPVTVFAAGILLLLYPTFSDWWNTFRQSRAVDAYTEKVSELDGAQYEEFWEEAEEYNRTLNADSYLHPMTEAEKEKYEAALNIEGNGMMGYVEIPSIDCLLPIYHGTDEAVLQIAVGHMEGTSLPIGGKGTHCVLSSHRGLPSARLFTDLDQLTEGDKFILHVLGEALVYLVDQIKVVEPGRTGSPAAGTGQRLLYADHLHALRCEQPSDAGAGDAYKRERGKYFRRTGDQADGNSALDGACVSVPPYF